MGFDVIGPTRRVCVAEENFPPLYDIFTLPSKLGIACPQLDRLNSRFYKSTTLRFSSGMLGLLRDELIRLRDAYQRIRGPALCQERHVVTHSQDVLQPILMQLLQSDPTYQAIEDFRLLCEEAIELEADVQCVGD